MVAPCIAPECRGERARGGHHLQGEPAPEPAVRAAGDVDAGHPLQEGRGVLAGLRVCGRHVQRGAGLGLRLVLLAALSKPEWRMRLNPGGKTCCTVSAAMGLVGAGRLRLLARSMAADLRPLGDTPAIAQIVAGFDFSSWIGLMAPNGLPPSEPDVLQRALAQALQHPELRKAFELNARCRLPAHRKSSALFSPATLRSIARPLRRLGFSLNSVGIERLTTIHRSFPSSGRRATRPCS